MKQFFLKMLSGRDEVSSFRFIFVLFGTLYTVAFITVWSYGSWAAGHPLNIEDGQRWLLGVLLSSKSINLAVEAFKNKSNGNLPTNGGQDATPPAQ